MLLEGYIEELTALHPNLFLTHIIGCMVAIMQNYSSSPCEFEVNPLHIPELPADGKHFLRVHWQTETEDTATRILATHHGVHVVEFAAIGVGCLLLPKALGVTKIQSTQIGNGANYQDVDWEYMVEMTGTQTASALPSLHQRKMEQLVHNRYRKPGYVVACSFDAKKILFSYHSSEE
jgi:hypothetical protein